MKKIITLIVVLMATFTGASAQNGSFAWYGADGKAQVETGIGNGTNTQGLWYVTDDSGDGGGSKIVWDVQTADGNPDDNLVKQCGGISGTAVLDKGSLMYDPYVDVCFDVVGKVSEDDYTPAAGNASDWGGIAIAYQSDIPAGIELGLGEFDAVYGYNNPIANIPESPEGTVSFVRIPWTSFKQPSSYHGDAKISGPEAAARLVSVRLKFRWVPGSYHFKILGIGSYYMQDVWSRSNETRTKVSAVQGTSSNLTTIPFIGQPVKKPTITRTAGAPAYFNINETDGCWQKKDGDKWIDVKSGTFNKGTWRFKCQVRIDNITDSGNQYVLDKNTEVSVDGVVWKNMSFFAGEDYSYLFVCTSEMEVNTFAWYGADGKAQVDTGMGNGTNTQGLWYVTDDSGDGGGSKIVWDVQTADGNPDDNLVKQCGGISGTAVLDKGTLMYNPFAGVCFDVVGKVSENDNTPAAGDASDWGGIAIAYQSDAAPLVELSLGEFDFAIGYACPQAKLPASPNGTTFARIPWSSFKQRENTEDNMKISGYDAAKQLVSIRFKVQEVSGNYHFNIAAIGAYNMAENGGGSGQPGIDTRTLITSVQASSPELADIPAIGSSVTKPTFTVTTGAPAYFDASNGCWQKKVDDIWQDVQAGTFSEGTWRFRCQVKINSSTDPNNLYVLANNVTVAVNGTAWGKKTVTRGDNYSSVEVFSPEVVVEDQWVDTRKQITSVQASSPDMEKIPAIGHSVTTKPTFTVTTGAPAYFDVSNGSWQKKVDGKWQDVQEGEFEEGTWRFKCQVRIDSSTDPNNQYVLSDDLLIKVNGTLCGRESVFVQKTYSYTSVNLPTIEVIDMGEEKFAWYGSDGIAKVETGLGNGSGDEGIWYVSNDNVFGGMSYVEWDCDETVGDYPDDALVQQCGGISGTAVLNNGGDESYDPFVDICFNVAGEVDVADATDWEGIAIAYTCDVAPILELGLGDDVDFNMDYARPQAMLQASPSSIVLVRIPWSSFIQPDSYMGEYQMSGPEAAQQLANVRFRVQGATDNSYHFNIVAVGAYNMTNRDNLPEPGMKKCATPTISYSGGKLKFSCETEDVQFNYNVKDDDIKSGIGDEIDLSVTYTITVYASKEDYYDSDIVTGTLCWIDQQPATEGIVDEDVVTEVKAMPVLIQTQGGIITIQGAFEGTPIAIYSIDGKKYGTTVAEKGSTTIATSLQPGSVAVVKIGQKAIKVVIR